MPSILYLAHNLNDPATWRRVAMLRRGGAKVKVAGFQRGDTLPPEPAEVFGRTRNAKMGQRALSVLRTWMFTQISLKEYDVVFARNLEMLVLAVAAVKRKSNQQDAPKLVYEVLDIHRLMLKPGVIGRILRGIEQSRLHFVELLIVSSPAFVSQYFDRYMTDTPPVMFLENKVTLSIPDGPEIIAKPQVTKAAPLTIGWFGILRCGFSLNCLDGLTRAAPGQFRVILRGMPAYDALPDFDTTVASNPDLTFGGPYHYPDDLTDIYANVDLAWLVDRYDAGENSDWLLPNRFYECGVNGVPPICLAGTQVARKAGGLGIGITIESPELAAVDAALSAVDAQRLALLRRLQSAVPQEVFCVGDAECRTIVEAVFADHRYVQLEQVPT